MVKQILILLTTFAVLSSASPAVAQQTEKVYRIGLLDASAPSQPRKASWRGFEQKMRELGYVGGRNIAFDRRWAHGVRDRLPGLARELVDLKVDVIVTAATPAAFAARRATSTIPTRSR